MAPRVLLSSVFKPFAINDMYSRKESIMELYHNQLTKVQGIYSLRNGYDSYGIHVIASNLGVPCTVLDFQPKKDLFRKSKKDTIISASAPLFTIFKKSSGWWNRREKYHPEPG